MPPIEFTEVERQMVAAMQAKLREAQVRAEAATASFQEALGVLLSGVLRARGCDLSAKYSLNRDGTALIEAEAAKTATPPPVE